MKHNFRELKIWRSAITISQNIYQLANQLPKDEQYGLSNQMRRCSVSIASNIAEGSGRSTTKDFSRFLDISISSCFELETQLLITNEVYQIDVEQNVNKIVELQKMIRGFQKTLKH